MLQVIGEIAFFSVALINIGLWILGGCKLPRYAHWLALVAFLLGSIASYEVFTLGKSIVSVFWLPFLFAGVVYVVFIIHGAGLPSDIRGGGKGKAMTKLVEASGEFEVEDLQPFLDRVSLLVPSGFGEAEVASIVALAQNMAVDDEKVVDFSIKYDDENTTLRLDVFMDDLDLPTVYFFAPPNLAELITAEMRTYQQEQEALEGE